MNNTNSYTCTPIKISVHKIIFKMTHGKLKFDNVYLARQVAKADS